MALIDPLLADDGDAENRRSLASLAGALLHPHRHTGFIAEARSRGVEPILLYVDDGTPRRRR